MMPLLDSNNLRLRDYGLLILRIVVGIVFIGHGYMKLKMGMQGTIGFMTIIGTPVPPFSAYFSVIAELVGGVAIILGILTLPFGIMLAIDMLGAIIYGKGGGSLFGPKGFELELLLLSASLAIALAGPGAISLANAMGRNRSRSRE